MEAKRDTHRDDRNLDKYREFMKDVDEVKEAPGLERAREIERGKGSEDEGRPQKVSE